MTPGKKSELGRTWRDNRLFVNAVVLVLKPSHLRNANTAAENLRHRQKTTWSRMAIRNRRFTLKKQTLRPDIKNFNPTGTAVRRSSASSDIDLNLINRGQRRVLSAQFRWHREWNRESSTGDGQWTAINASRFRCLVR